MKSNLDASHHTVLTNYHTFERAQRCAEEIDAYVLDVLRAVFEELPSNVNPPVKFAFNKKGYVQACAFPYVRKINFELIAIGIENFKTADIITAGSGGGCRAYIYCAELQDAARATKLPELDRSLRGLRPPPDFKTSSEPGYLFVMPLDRVSAEICCDRASLHEHFRKPLVELFHWLIAAAPELAEIRQSLCIPTPRSKR